MTRTGPWHRLGARLAHYPVLAPVLAGALVRGIAAIVGSGFHARDDYFHVLEPAYRWLRDPVFNWDESGLPGAGIRSHLVPRLVQGALELFTALGVEDPEWSVRLLSLLVGAYGLLVVPATYFAAGRLFTEPEARTARLAAWLAALHFVMPYAGTRLLLSALAMPPLVLAVGFAASARNRELVFAGFFVGLACWLRLQIGAAALGFAILFVLRGWRAAGPAGSARQLGLFVAGGAVAVVLQGVFDLATTGVFFGPVWHNLLLNACALAADPEASSCLHLQHIGLAPNFELSRENPFAYLGMWLALTMPPATILLLPAMLRAGRRQALVAWPFVLFVLAHSVIPHKEERFMLPVFPLYLLLLAAVPEALAGAAGRWWEIAKTWWPRTRWWLIAMHALALVLAITHQSQRAQRQAMAALRADSAARAVISLGPEVQAFLLARDDLPVRRRREPSAAWLHDTLTDLAQQGIRANRFLGFTPDRDEIAAQLQAEGALCEAPTLFESWWLDRLLCLLNPRHNRRRAPVLLWRCEQTLVAGTTLGRGRGQ